MAQAARRRRPGRTSRIVAATRNEGKLREIRQVLAPLGVSVSGLGERADIPEPDETGDGFADNARAKALYYARATGQVCLADDSGLAVDALDGRPGVRSARYAEERFPIGADRATRDRLNSAKLLEALRGVGEERRTARFVCHLALADAGGVLLEARGTLEGRIAERARGANGFGYDPVFRVPSRGCTAAELSAEDKNAISHRGQALRRLAEGLRCASRARGAGEERQRDSGD